MTNWQDHVTEFTNKFREFDNPDGTITHEPAEGEVIQEGTPQNASNFNNIERGIFSNNQQAAELTRMLRLALESNIQPTAKLHSFDFPKDMQDILSTSWELYLVRGGIHAPLEAWGFTNAVMTTVPHRVAIDMNSKTVTIYTIPELAGRRWEALQSEAATIHFLTEDGLTLILTRR